MKFKTILILSVLLVTAIASKSQNLLRESESGIKQHMSARGVYFAGKKYTTDGSPFLEYSYSITTAKNDGLLDEIYYLNESGTCYSILMFYNDIKFLEAIVESFKSSGQLVKVPEKFAWINNTQFFDIEVTVNENETFLIRYHTRKLPAKL